jgi:hypothetical protein
LGELEAVLCETTFERKTVTRAEVLEEKTRGKKIVRLSISGPRADLR